MAKERLLPQSEALDYVKKLSGKRPSPSTFQRWRLRGVHGVKLRVMLITGTLYTKASWLEEFFERSAEAKLDKHSKKTRQGIRRSKMTELESEVDALLGSESDDLEKQVDALLEAS